MVLAAFLGVFLAMCVGGAIVLIRSDRKRATRRAPGTALQGRPLPPGTPVEVFVRPEAATQIARSAIQLVGAHDIRDLNNGSVIGWIGSSVTNIPSKAEYMVAVSRVIQPDGSVVLGCSAQPRYSSMAFGSRRSAELTHRLVSEVTNLASSPAS
jgi:hypothetical protein